MHRCICSCFCRVTRAARTGIFLLLFEGAPEFELSGCLGMSAQCKAGQWFEGYRLHCVHVHCNTNSIYVFLFWELRGLSPNFHVHVSVSDLYIPRIGPHIFLQQNRQIDPGNRSISHRYVSVETGRKNVIILFWK
jgi:hypothetical protein